MATQPALLPNTEDKELFDSKHEAARAEFEEIFEGRPGFEGFATLIAKGYTWREAAYIAWLATPTQHRWPPQLTQPKDGQPSLIEILGLKRSGSLSKLKGRPDVQAQIAILAKSYIVFDKVPEVMQTLAENAAKESYRYHNDRRLFLEVAGVYGPTNKISISLDQDADLSTLTNEQLLEIAELEGLEDGSYTTNQ